MIPRIGTMDLASSSLVNQVIDERNYSPLAFGNIHAWFAQAGNINISTVGTIAPTIQGTQTAATISTTNLHQYTRRCDALVTVASTSAVAGFLGNYAGWARGSAAKVGGFRFYCRWGPATGVATATMRAFCGMSVQTTITDIEPSSLLNMMGMGWDAADTNIKLMSNDGSGTATKTDLGASFPVPTVDRTSVYQLEMSCLPNGTSFDYKVTDLVSDAVAQGTISADLPVNTTLMRPALWMSVGGTNSVIGVAMAGMTLGCDY